MNICEEKSKTKVFVQGNLYCANSVSGVYIYNAYYKTFVSLQTGHSFTNLEHLAWVDVTDQYCLNKV